MQRGGTLFTMRPHRIIAACASAIALGAVAGFGSEFLGWFGLFVAVAYGTFAGEMIMRASGRKRGARLEIIAGAGMALGAVGGRLIVALFFTRGLGQPAAAVAEMSEALRLAIPSPIALVSLVIGIATAVGRIRYI
jgi:hypothetical protein